MKTKRTLGIIFLILGVVLYIFGSYISGEVAKGRQQISSAQKSVDKGRGFSQLSPFTKDVGGMLADSAQKKIDEGRQQADEYEALANWLHIGGIVIFIVGVGFLAFSFSRKKRK
ncbi:MAG: hypothetical protein COT84_05015 [Chlamydiae bacterium CG10_big_fil_rev_8_21_14_0_10_35_9]|nr:MAG: hypothetical protein COT84_05015 [Chlamydiae bacterium CG10_big_fil_rev_8_21_14_0_10_35_9]